VEDYCVNENSLIEERTVNHCSSNDCNYYDCSAGTCIEHRTTCPSACDVTSPSGCDIGYYLYDSDNHKLVDTETTGTLYYCDEADSCKVVGKGTSETGKDIPTGYLVNSDKTNNETYGYIKCVKGECTAVSVATKENCADTGVVIGDVIKVDVKTFICNEVSASGGIEVASTDDEKQVFVNVSAANNAFGVTQNTDYPFVIANLDGGNAVLNGKDDTRYHYTNKDDTTNLIQARKSTAICGANIEKIQEFKKDDCTNTDVDYYKKINV
jgi:hypothetical protein